MAIISIGAKLIRDTRLGRVITETVGNKVFTNVYSKGGDIVSQRVKQISKAMVGNKSVTTVKKVTKKSNSPVKVTILDRVFGKNGKKLGTRYTKLDEDTKYVKKTAGAKIQRKNFKYGKVIERHYSQDSGEHWIYPMTEYNNKGLPKPSGSSNAFEDMSLVDMRKYQANEGRLYAKEGSGLEFLNRYDEFVYTPTAREKLNFLDKYL